MKCLHVHTGPSATMHVRIDVLDAIKSPSAGDKKGLGAKSTSGIFDAGSAASVPRLASIGAAGEDGTANLALMDAPAAEENDTARTAEDDEVEEMIKELGENAKEAEDRALDRSQTLLQQILEYE